MPMTTITTIVVLIVVLRLFAGRLDRHRIDDYIADRGGRVERIRWTPTGPGWLGAKNERIYEVIYRDANNRRHCSACKTSLCAGVYWTADRVVPGPPDEIELLREENRRLRGMIQRVGGRVGVE